jgi:hypothetical protein
VDGSIRAPWYICASSYTFFILSTTSSRAFLAASYGYFKAHNCSTMVFDDDCIKWDDNDFPDHDWSDFYHVIADDFPSIALELRGMPVQINAFVNASQGCNRGTRCSHIVLLIYLNKAPIIWHSNLQCTMETLTFGSEFIALKTGTKLIKSLHCRKSIMVFATILFGKQLHPDCL